MSIIKETGIFFKENVILFTIILFAACLRFPGLFHGLPVYPDADEPFIISIAVRIFKGQWNPHFFHYPSLCFYLNAALIGVTHVVYHTLHFLGVTSSPSTPYWMFFAAGRIASALLSLAAVWLVYRIGCLVFSRRMGFYSMVIMALMPILYTYSVNVAPNALLVVAALSSIYYSMKYLVMNKDNHLYLAALCAGLALGAKYMFPVPLSFLIAKYFVDRKYGNKFIDIRLLSSVVLVGVTFIITTPALLFSFQEWIGDILFEHRHYSSCYAGHGFDNAFLFYLQYLFLEGITPLVFICSIVGMVVFFRRKKEELAVLCIVPLVWFLFCSMYSLTSVRNIALISVVFAVGAGIALDSIPKLWIRYLLLLFLVTVPLVKDIQQILLYRKPDIRCLVEEWINENLPRGSVIAREEYTPYYSEERFESIYIGICGLAFMTPDSVRNLGCDYVISAGYERFERDPEMFPENVENIRKHKKEFAVIKIFDPGTRYRGRQQTLFKVK